MMKQKELAAALKGILVLCLATVLVVGGLLVPSIALNMRDEFPECAFYFWPCLSAFWLSCVPVVVVLALVWRMATQIARDNSFCQENADRLKWICILAIADTAFYLLGAVVLAVLNRGLQPYLLILFGGVIVVGITITVVAAVLSHLVQKAADLKAEQDLTI
jgi:hypothetical protein